DERNQRQPVTDRILATCLTGTAELEGVRRYLRVQRAERHGPSEIRLTDADACGNPRSDGVDPNHDNGRMINVLPDHASSGSRDAQHAKEMISIGLRQWTVDDWTITDSSRRYVSAKLAAVSALCVDDLVRVVVKHA